jgi:hypothetical protein
MFPATAGKASSFTSAADEVADSPVSERNQDQAFLNYFCAKVNDKRKSADDDCEELNGTAPS